MRKLAKTVLAISLFLPLTGCVQADENMSVSGTEVSTEESTVDENSCIFSFSTGESIQMSLGESSDYSVELSDSSAINLMTSIDDEPDPAALITKDGETIFEIRFLDATLYDSYAESMSNNDAMSFSESGMINNSDYRGWSTNDLESYFLIRVEGSGASVILHTTVSEQARDALENLSFSTYTIE